MRKLLLAIMMAFSLMIMPFAVYGQSEQIASNSPPPVSQQLVPEGDFALSLVSALGLGTATTEEEAEDMLLSVGIAPQNGWIADYPMTPIIIGELQDTVVAAADAHKLPMGKDDALKAFQDLTTEFGLAVVPGDSGQYGENQAQLNTTEINNYYYGKGPPVVTYYPPPWDYHYLYDWVPYPFWSSGFFFPGFFVLSDFNVIVVGHHHHRHRITNHFIDPKTHAVFRVDPEMRRIRRTGKAPEGYTRRFRSSEGRKAATSIFDRSLERRRMSSGTTGRMMNREGNTGRQNEMKFRQEQGRSSNPPNVIPKRSFKEPSTIDRGFGSSENSRRSFSPPSRSFSKPQGSFGDFRDGGFSGDGFRGGGFRGSYGGFRR